MSLQSGAGNVRELQRTAPPSIDRSGAEVTDEDPTNISHNTISHIQNLPEELICLIFVQYIECGNSAWRLTLVCRKWYNTALMCHSLWSNIQIGPKHSRKKKWSIPGITKPVQSLYQYQFCSQREDLKEVIGRSGKSELAVKIWMPVVDDDLFEVLDELLAPGVADRVWHLGVNIGAPQYWNRSEETTKLLNALANTPLTRLRSIDLPSFNDLETSKSIFNNIITNSGKIKEAKLDVSMMYRFIPDTFWESLKLLQDYGSNAEEDRASSHVISLCQKLENLQLTWRQDEVPTITLSNLTSLSIIITSPHFANLTLPRLESLRITANFPFSYEEPWVAREANYPLLHSLEFFGPDTTWMSKFHMPILRSLSVHTDVKVSKEQPEHFMEFFLGKSFPFLYTLKIYSACGEEEFVSTLEAVPNVQSLLLVPKGMSGNGFGDKVFRRLSELINGELVCQRLNEVYIGTEHSPAREKVDTKKAKEMADVRAKAGYPLEALDIVAWEKGVILTKCAGAYIEKSEPPIW